LEGGFWISRRSGWNPKIPVSVRRCSVAVITHGWGTEVLRATATVCDEPRGVRVFVRHCRRTPERSSRTRRFLVGTRRFRWNPKIPVSVRRCSGEHPKMLGWRPYALWGTEVLRCTVLLSREPQKAHV